jgi:hypothetical protein
MTNVWRVSEAGSSTIRCKLIDVPTCLFFVSGVANPVDISLSKLAQGRIVVRNCNVLTAHTFFRDIDL